MYLSTLGTHTYHIPHTTHHILHNCPQNLKSISSRQLRFLPPHWSPTLSALHDPGSRIKHTYDCHFHGVSLMFGPYFGCKPPPLPTELARARHRGTPIKPVNSPQPSSNGEAACVDAHLDWTSFQPLLRLDSILNPSARSHGSDTSLYIRLCSVQSWFLGMPSLELPLFFVHVGTCFPSGKSSSPLQSSTRPVPTRQVGSVSCRKSYDSTAPSSVYVVEILNRHDLI